MRDAAPHGAERLRHEPRAVGVQIEHERLAMESFRLGVDCRRHGDQASKTTVRSLTVARRQAVAAVGLLGALGLPEQAPDRVAEQVELGRGVALAAEAAYPLGLPGQRLGVLAQDAACPAARTTGRTTAAGRRLWKRTTNQARVRNGDIGRWTIVLTIRNHPSTAYSICAMDGSRKRSQ